MAHLSNRTLGLQRGLHLSQAEVQNGVSILNQQFSSTMKLKVTYIVDGEDRGVWGHDRFCAATTGREGSVKYRCEELSREHL